MRIVVLNGSPKGVHSITLQYVRFLEKKYPQHAFQVFNVAHDIRKIEVDEALFHEIIGQVIEADGILWAFPLYYFLVSAQYKKFIELIWERKVENTFRDKYTAAISTSIHLFEHTAHNYIHGICDDLEMKFLGSYSADMYDLTKEPEQKRFLIFFDEFLRGIEKGISTAREYAPLRPNPFQYESKNHLRPVDPGEKKILILTVCLPGQTNLAHMVERLKGCFRKAPQVVNLFDVEMKGGCLGCIYQVRL
jgi:NAD(P)H-dependent FMN reductase